MGDLDAVALPEEEHGVVARHVAAAQGGQGQWSWPNLAAVYVIVVTPGILAFTFAQKLFFKGLLEGALKG